MIREVCVIVIFPDYIASFYHTSLGIIALAVVVFVVAVVVLIAVGVVAGVVVVAVTSLPTTELLQRFVPFINSLADGPGNRRDDDYAQHESQQRRRRRLVPLGRGEACSYR